MFSRLHNRLGTAGLVVAVVALVAALAGTAFAATKLNGTQKKEVEKIAKKHAGKNGTNGTNGTNGAPGANGKDGTNGSAGAPGAAGKSVVLTTETPGSECKEGGTKVEVEGNPASKKYVCNGKEGEEGPEGSPWTELGVLPPSKTETGAWSVQTFEGVKAESNAWLEPISFTIPLAVDIPAENTHVEPVGYTGTEPECPGTAAAPKAQAGHLCVYTSRVEGPAITPFFVLKTATASPEGGASTSGAELVVLAEEEAAEAAAGSWAVTAPAAP